MGRRKPKTITPEKLRNIVIDEISEDAYPIELAIERPKTRADCVNGPRPCGFVSCKYHLYLDISPKTGSLKLNFPDKEPWELEETCALDIADKGGVALEIISRHMNLTRERVRQIEEVSIGKMKKVAAKTI